MPTPQLDDSDYISIRGVRLDLTSIIDATLFKSVDQLRGRFSNNRPFPHIVLDGLFSSNLLDLVHDEFAHVAWDQWERYDSANEKKRGSSWDSALGPATQLYFNTIHSRSFVQFLQRVTGIEGLLPDPELFGGGLHEIPDGGHFSPHIDFKRHPVTGLVNRLVLITYLNKNWQPSYGGVLELWDADNNAASVNVEPVFGRTILFAQSPKALHGHPVPVRAPDRRTRRSVAAYFYSNDRVDQTVFQTTQFVAATRPKSTALGRRIKYVLPPFVVDIARGLMKTLARYRVTS